MAWLAGLALGAWSVVLAAEKAVCLSWPEHTAEEQIVVGAASPEGPWVPWPEPGFNNHGRRCMAVPITFGEQWLTPYEFFKLVPGTQYCKVSVTWGEP